MLIYDNSNFEGKEALEDHEMDNPRWVTDFLPILCQHLQLSLLGLQLEISGCPLSQRVTLPASLDLPIRDYFFLLIVENKTYDLPGRGNFEIILSFQRRHKNRVIFCLPFLNKRYTQRQFSLHPLVRNHLKDLSVEKASLQGSGYIGPNKSQA